MRVRALAPRREPERPVLEGLAVALLDGCAHEALGYRSLGDDNREQFAWGPGGVREWARMWQRLGEFPVLRGAVLSGEIGWRVPGRVIGLATPDTEEVCLATVLGRTLRAAAAIVAAVRRRRTRRSAPHPSRPPCVEEVDAPLLADSLRARTAFRVPATAASTTTATALPGGAPGGARAGGGATRCAG